MSVKWFYITSRNKIGLQYEPDNLDLNKFCFAKCLNIPSTHEKSRFEAMDYINF